MGLLVRLLVVDALDKTWLAACARRMYVVRICRARERDADESKG